MLFLNSDMCFNNAIVLLTNWKEHFQHTAANQQYRKQARFLRPNLSNLCFSQAHLLSLYSRMWGDLRPYVPARRQYGGTQASGNTLMGNDAAEHFLSHRTALN